MILGSVGAFLVLESRAHAEARGAHIYAAIDAIEGDRGSREAGRLETRLERLLEPAKERAGEGTVVFCGTTGFQDLAARERAVLEAVVPGAALRAYGGLTGHALETQFPLGLALAALTLDGRAKVPPFDTGRERAMTAGATTAVVTTVGHVRGEGVALLSANA
jgi:3-oxoacyl-[acyl-carrier-protein] synthase II